MPERRNNHSRLALGCYILASYFFIVVLMAAVGNNSGITVPGVFLFDRFHLASFYLPVILLFSGLLISSGRLPRQTMMLLWISPILFLTSAVMFQLLAGSTHVLASRVLIDAFGRFPASALFVLLLAMEIAGVVKLASYYSNPDDKLFTLEEIRLRISDISRFLGLSNIEGDETAAGGEEPTLEDRPPMAFPSFPDAPEPIEDNIGIFPEAPVQPLNPGSPVSDPAVSDLIRRALTGASVPGEKPVIDHSDIPDLSAFPPPVDLTPAPADNSDPAFDFLAGKNRPSDNLMADVMPETELEPELDPQPVTDPEPEVFRSSFSFRDDHVDLAEILPEEERDISDISGKLDPQGTEPKGILAGAAPKSRPRKRKKYEVPVRGLLADYPESDFSSIDDHARKSAEVLEQTLKEFRIEAKVTGIRKGPVITMFELLPSPGVKISSIVNLQDNIALRLAASRVRIIAPIPGKHAVGIEVPNKKRAIVSFSSLVESEEFQESDAGIPVILGKDISGGNQIIDLTRTPHLLIAGATGSGKSVCVNSLIGSILYSRQPHEVKMIMVDPKIVELKLYNDIPHLLTPVITDPKRALQALQWCLYEMERRYSLLDTQGVRDIKTFNKRVKDRKLATEPLPYIVVLVDEFADLMATSGKELEAIVARLAAMSRAVGIHLVLATQRPSVDVITGLIKANFPSRIAFMVAGKTDSRIIIDAVGAEKLLGRGDMLFTSAWDPFPSRMQGAFLAEEEVERMADHVKTLGEPDYIDDEMFVDEDDESEFRLESVSGDDPMYEKALEIVVSSRKASASYLQRRLKIGYNRAARLVEEMERRGIVGPPNGSKPRDLIHIPERFVSSSGPADREPSSA